MALPFAPHTVIVRPPKVNKSPKGVVNGTTFPEGHTLQVCVTAKDPQELFDRTRVVYKNPHRMMMDLADAAKVPPQSDVSWGERRFKVVTPPRISQHGLPTDHASVMLEEQEA